MIDNQSLGKLGFKYGFMRLEFLKENREEKYTTMMIEGTLQKHLEETQRMAQERVQLLVVQMSEKEGVTETLKVQDQMKWVQMMNNILSRAEEIVTNEIIYS